MHFLLVTMTVILSTVIIIMAHQPQTDPSGSSTLSKKLLKFHSSRLGFTGKNYLVTMTLGTDDILSKVRSSKFLTQQEHELALLTQLQNEASTSQKPALDMLQNVKNDGKISTPEFRFRSLWLTNQIILYSPTDAVLESILALPEVASVTPESFYRISPIDDLGQSGSVSLTNVHSPSKSSSRYPWELCQETGNDWNMLNIGLDKIGENLRKSQDIKVCVCDTGIYAEHEVFGQNTIIPIDTLADSTDPADQDVTDDHGHGTNCASYIANMAPQATIYACNCLPSSGSGTTLEILICWQRMCQEAAGQDMNLVISNSWGTTQLDLSLHTAIKVVREFGISVVVAIGNSGCSATMYPGNDLNVVGVGATDRYGYAAYFTSCDTSSYWCGRTPNLAAPGVATCGAYIRDPADYVLMSGTSMATPHVAGAMAILRLICPCAGQDDLLQILNLSATQLTDDQSNLCGLGGCTGSGQLNISRAVEIAPIFCRGRLTEDGSCPRG